MELRTLDSSDVAAFTFGLERGFLLVDGVLHDELHMALTIASQPRAGTNPLK